MSSRCIDKQGLAIWPEFISKSIHVLQELFVNICIDAFVLFVFDPMRINIPKLTSKFDTDFWIQKTCMSRFCIQYLKGASKVMYQIVGKVQSFERGLFSKLVSTCTMVIVLRF